ncbi:VOC family protein [Flexivirga meconopsidis]|uniref:VOC family protein n=1 Tax=Flexivirga meconopsidis TaxID=2977121 RepID=UPI00223EA0A1|nr:VOC family protein [Flexivirga meconopsidis]
MLLDHTIVPARDKVASAQFVGHVLGRTMKPNPGHFAQLPINESLTLDFADEIEDWGGPGFDPMVGKSHHFAFVVTPWEYDDILARIRADGIPYGSGPFRHTDGREYTARGGRGVYFEDPAGNIFEVMTVPETGYPEGFTQQPVEAEA